MSTSIQNRIVNADHEPHALRNTGRAFELTVPKLSPAQPIDQSLSLFQIVTPNQAEPVKVLMRSFVEWLRIRYKDTPWFIDGYFDRLSFEAELAALPGTYGPPHGRLLLATSKGNPAGCVGLRRLTNDSSEMKRLYVDPEFHGKGVGRILVTTLISEARKIGYRRMLLDTGRKQIEAQNLYRSLGFTETAPYYDVAPKQREMLVFMQRML